MGSGKPGWETLVKTYRKIIKTLTRTRAEVTPDDSVISRKHVILQTMTAAARSTISAVCSHHKYSSMWHASISLTTLTQHEVPASIPWIYGGQTKLYRGFLRELRLSPVTSIAPMLHTHSNVR